MYNRYFGFKENPFSIAPDPRFLYISDMHQDALAHLNYGVSADGCIILLTGEVGTGKTTICRYFLEQLDETTDVAVILNPKLSALELLAAVCDEFQITVEKSSASIKSHIDRLNHFLLKAHAQNRRCLLVIDEAQNLDMDVLEMVRLLTNLETNKRKLLKIFLLGQSELSTYLKRPDMTQIDQRITVRFHLKGLPVDDMESYIRHRIVAAGGGENRTIFDKRAVKKIHRLTGGIPRLINTLCERSLLGAYSRGRDSVDASIVKQAGREIFTDTGSGKFRWKSLGTLIAAAVTALLILVLVAAELNEFDDSEQVASDSQSGPLIPSPTSPDADPTDDHQGAPAPQSVDVEIESGSIFYDTALSSAPNEVKDLSPGHEPPVEAPRRGDTKIVIKSMTIND